MLDIRKIESLLDVDLITQATSFDRIQESLRVTQEIIENLSPKALIELNSGYENDRDKLLKAMITETYASMYGGVESKSVMGKFSIEGVYYLDKLGETMEEILRVENFLYFLMSVMPDFELNWHHIEWCEMVQRYKYLNILAARDHGKCLDPETPIRMYDGSIKKIKHIVVGDKVMGPDSNLRTVLELHSGEDEMFKIKQSRGDDYIVNSRHTLTLFHNYVCKVVDIDIQELLKIEDYQNTFKGLQFARGLSIQKSHIKIEPIGRGKYVGFTCDGDHRFLLGDGTVTHNSYFWSNAEPAWRLYRYNKNSKRPEIGKLGKEGWLFSFSKTQATRLLTTLKETIEDNPILREKLMPERPSDGSWAETKIRCKNGAKVIVGSAGDSVRGAHPGWIRVDDFLKDNVLYSKQYREKSTAYFHSVIMNMIQPGGNVVVVGTPFHAQDLYGDLKTKSGWHYREYPSIFPNGKLLWRRRYDFKTLMEKRETQGTINFSREHLCRPITNESSIFPFHILERSLVGTKNICMAKNIESFPIRLVKVGIGVDLAISSSVAADYSVMVVGGVDEADNVWIVDYIRLHGASYNEQIAKLKSLNLAYRPHIVNIESNGFQAMFGDGANAEGLPVAKSTTTSKSKNDLKTGLPGIALLFERGKFKVPHGDKYSIDKKDEMFAEFSSITYTDKGLQATNGHDDIPMAVHQLIRGLSYGTGFGVTWM